MTRLAVHAACDREMATAVREYRSWIICQNQGARRAGTGKSILGSKYQPDPPKDVTRSSTSPCPKSHEASRRLIASTDRIMELQRMPVSQRPLRWLMMCRRAELENQASELDAMLKEERQQRFIERCVIVFEQGSAPTNGRRTPPGCAPCS